MPLYEYTCDSCTFAFEELVIGKAEVGCPKCASTAVTRQLSVFASPSVSGAEADVACTSPTPSPTAGCGGGGCGHCH